MGNRFEFSPSKLWEERRPKNFCWKEDRPIVAVTTTTNSESPLFQREAAAAAAAAAIIARPTHSAQDRTQGDALEDVF